MMQVGGEICPTVVGNIPLKNVYIFTAYSAIHFYIHNRYNTHTNSS